MTINKDACIIPEYLFEVSWEVTNMVGGIHTVISTKARVLSEMAGTQHLFVGPDRLEVDETMSGFIPDENLFPGWVEAAQKEGLSIKVGRWDIPGKPFVILVEFSSFYGDKDKIFTEFWLDYKLDSLTEGCDYI